MIEIIIGDITKRDEQAIVNSANPSLLAGGGVCGAIHQAAGPDLEAECLTYGGCPVGEARITTGCDLTAYYVIHAVAPRWWGGSKNEEAQLRRCYQSVFELVRQHRINSVALPAIGVGIYGWPLAKAVKIAVEETKAAQATNAFSAVFCCFDAKTFEAYSVALGAI